MLAAEAAAETATMAAKMSVWRRICMGGTVAHAAARDIGRTGDPPSAEMTIRVQTARKGSHSEKPRSEVRSWTVEWACDAPVPS